jgi:hypothetical protein
MNRRSSWIGGSVLAALLFGILAAPEADARGGRGGGGHGGGGGGHFHAPRVSSAQRAFKMPSVKPPKMPHAAGPSKGNAAQGHGRTNNAMARANNAMTRNNTGQTHTNNAKTRTNNAATTGTKTAAGTGTTNAAGNTTGTRSTTSSPYAYTYGAGAHARSYRAYGYGHGYRNRSYGSRYGYGRSQSNNRAVVSRLRSTHRSLARIDTDYRGHRVRAMHAISMAIRQLSHRSMVYGNAGFANGLNTNRNVNNLALGRRQNGRNGIGAGRRNQRMPQQQSDAVMSQALRNLQGVNMQLSSQGSNTSGHARARGHVQHAMRELNTALAIR